MHPVGFEPIISAVERPQTNAWDHAATGTGRTSYYGHDFEIGLVITRNNSSV